MRYIIVIAFSVFISSCGGTATPRETADLVISGGTVIHPDQSTIPVVEDIVIRDGNIIAVGDNISANYETATSFDASGRFIIPGLVDMHSHFGNGILRPEVDDTTQVLARHLYFGNTTILNIG